MSRFVRDLAGIERRNGRVLWISRSAASLAAASLVWLVVWSSGLDHALFHWLKSRTFSAPAVTISHLGTKAAPPQLVLGKTHVRAFGGLRSSVSKTPEHLVLTGTIPGRSPHEGIAFIGVDARHPQTYSAGALLANGARLTAIYQKYVILEKGDAQSRLYLNGSGDNKLPSYDDSMLLVVGGSDAHTTVAASEHEEFAKFIRETPVYAGAVVRGIQVYPGRLASVFARMGLRPGDLITSLDGVPLTDPTEAVTMFRQLAAGTSETAELTRGGKSETVTLDGSLMTGEGERDRGETNSSVPVGMPST